MKIITILPLLSEPPSYVQVSSKSGVIIRVNKALAWRTNVITGQYADTLVLLDLII